MIRQWTLLLFSSLSLILPAQVKVGEWRDHLPYNKIVSVAKAGNFIYAANGAGLLKYNTADESVEKLSTINGLSDVGTKLLRYCEYNNSLLVIYDNTNIDVIHNNAIMNASDIKRKAITGKKYINEVSFYKNLAYIACGFGIVVFDVDRLEVKDTYIIGPGGTNLEIYQVARTDSTIFAATEDGIYKASAYNPILTNFQAWQKLPGFPAGPYNCAVNYNGKILVNYSEYTKTLPSGTPVNGADTIYQYDGQSWTKYTDKPNPYTIHRMYSYDAKGLLLIDQFGVERRRPDASLAAYITQYGFATPHVNDVVYEDHEPQYNLYWCADNSSGLVRSYGNYPEPSAAISVPGPGSSLVNNFAVKNNKLLVAPVSLSDDGSLYYINEGVYEYNGSNWNNQRSPANDTTFDINNVVYDKKDLTRFWASSWYSGVLEYKNNVVVNVYGKNNSTLSPISASPNWIRCSGLAVDDSYNLWVGNSNVTNFLSVKKANGTWQSFNFSNFISQPSVGQILIDKNKQKWIVLTRGSGILVYNDKAANFAAPSTANTKLITTAAGSGLLPTAEVFCLAEDQDGEIWVATSQGIAVFYNPENIFTNSNWDSQQILIQQDGYTQILLGTETINAIAVDGANRKWVGTASSGVFCFSPDGQTEIHHFTTDNSPIYANEVHSLAIDETTGDVFIGTSKGIQSYRTSTIKGFEQYTNVHSYPNPIRPGYTGNVYITGLMDASVVKITDIAGNLVWETKSEGGQIEWNLQNFKGERAASGVYIVYCALSDGTQSAVTKLMVIHK